MKKLSRIILLTRLILFSAAAANAAKEFSLNGKWQIIFDRQNQGRGKKWQLRENFEKYYDLRSIQVPSCWETTEQDYEGVAWYGKSFKAPAGWKSKTVRINFGAVNYRAEVWLNGEPVGYHDGGYTPFEFEIGDLISYEKENFLTLRIIGPIVSKDIVIEGFGKDDTPHWRGALTGGIWQSVTLLATDQIYIKNVFVEPDIHTNTATIHVTLQNSGTKIQEINAGFNISLKKSPGVKVISKNQKVSVAPGETKLSITLPVKNARYWSPDSPDLYVLDLNIGNADRKKTTFGMREFTLKNDDFYLNGKKLYMKTGFWEGLYPNTLAFPENEEIIRKEFALAKEIGFNCLRPWRKQVPPITLELADELGMLIIGSPAIECMNQWPTATPYMESRFKVEFTEMVERDRNHPSIIMWELYNEIERNAVGRLKFKTAVMVRNLDPSRLIIDESGGWHDGTNAYVPYSLDPVFVNEIHNYKPAPVENSTYDELATLAKTDQNFTNMIGGTNKIASDKLLFISEVGYGGLPNLDENMIQYRKTGNPITPDYRYTERLQKTFNQVIDDMKIRDIFPTVGAYAEASQEIQAQGNKIQLEAVRVNPKVDGYCVHAFTDGDWILGAGIIDLFRNKKKTFYTIKEVNQPLYLAVRTAKQNLYAGENTGLIITAINEIQQQKGTLAITVMDKENRAAYTHSEEVTLPAGIKQVYTNNTLALKSGSYHIKVQFSVGGKTITANQFPVWVYEKEMAVLPASVTVVNAQDKLSAFIKKSGVKSNETTAFTKDEIIVVARQDTSSEQKRSELLKVLDHVRNGGTAIYLNPFSANRNNSRERSQYLPFELQSKGAAGHWISVGHVVKPHPIFDGLPSGRLMGQEYQNVVATRTVTNLSNATPVVGSMSWDIGTHISWDYEGPNNAWWGNDLSVTPYGKGKVVISTLRLIENLGTDPVADKILYNLIKWASTDINTAQK